MAYPNITYVPSQQAMLSQPYATVGDISYREDLDETFTLIALPSFVLANWAQTAPSTGGGGGGGGGNIGPVKVGNGVSGNLILTTLPGSGGGPVDPTTVVGYAQVMINFVVYWLPLFQ